MSMNDPYDLARFVHAQERVYPTVLEELRSGSKWSHWMWFIFPQIEGLGASPTSVYYSIKSAEEARQYLAHPVLGPRLRECSQILLSLQDRSAEEVFGFPDDLKLKSCMTLFESVSEDKAVFAAVLDRYFAGLRDPRTLAVLSDQGKKAAGAA